MALSIQTPRIYLLIISAFSLLAPQESRHEWRREWEAEIVSHWLLLKKWKRLNARSKLDLFNRVRGSFMDVMGFQQTRTTLVLVTLNILVALLTGFGAVKEFVVGGIRDRQIQPFLLSSVAIGVSVLFLISAVAMLRRWVAVRPLVILTGTLSILLHVYGALPPHRNMGFLVLIIGAGYGVVMMFAYQRNSRRNPITYSKGN